MHRSTVLVVCTVAILFTFTVRKCGGSVQFETKSITADVADGGTIETETESDTGAEATVNGSAGSASVENVVNIVVNKRHVHQVDEEGYLVEDVEFSDPPVRGYRQPYTYGTYRRQPASVLPNSNTNQVSNMADVNNDGIAYTREISVKQGRLKGLVRVMHPQSGLKSVEQYLGLPYAEAPVGTKRFMPPGAPPPWHGVRLATKLSPVCPQNLPNLSNANEFSQGRYNQIKRLLPYLKVENEDCLFLNIYVPSWEGVGTNPKYPVIIYIHGESFEWNSGNPYDGSVLASYGQVLVVTLNYRLGILGFMKPSISEHTVSNFGLLDQIAALQWVKDNIGAFGGDNKAVTLMGHGTGAACVNLLMVSPVAKGLFRRAILMSGSALSDWATTNHSLQSTMQVAQSLNCPLNDAHEEMLACFQKKRYGDILQTKTMSPKFSTQFGPIVDGLVVPNLPHKVMGQYSDIFSRYDLLFGMTELESYHSLNAVALMYGLLENERDNLLRYYMQNRFEIRPDLALAATLREYTDIYTDPNKAQADEHRDTILEILSDARVTAPLLQTGLYHATVNPKSYMYVFGHNSEAGEYSNLPQSVIGEELAYVFGAPLASAGPFQPHYNSQERLFAEAVIKYWTNFAKTGNPKAPWRELFLNLNPADWERYDVDWPEFGAVNRSYLNLGMPPVIGHKYRQKYMQFWNQELPNELKRVATMRVHPPFADLYPPSTTMPRGGTSTNPDFESGYFNLYAVRSSTNLQKPTNDPYRTIKLLMTDPLVGPGMYNAQSNFVSTTTDKPIGANSEVPTSQESEIERAESMLHILIGVIVVFLVINLVVMLAYLVRRNISSKKLSSKLDDTIFDGTTDEDMKRSKINDGDDSFILDIIRKPGTKNMYEPVKTGQSPINGFKMTRQLSTNTIDPHSKVREWISQEIVKCSPKYSKKKLQAPVSSVKNTSFLKKPRKVSVAIDATPSARSISVLRQEPIEVTKAKGAGDTISKDVIICQDIEMNTSLIDAAPLRYSGTEYRRGSSGSAGTDACNLGLVIGHKHSYSDPVQNFQRPTVKCEEEITSFIEDVDINVTSREKSYDKELLSPEEALRVIQRRNYPKVLPDQSHTTAEVNALKRRSLPPQYFMSQSSYGFGPKIPPAPPPRTTSTLGRRPSERRSSKNFITSPLMVAEEPPNAEEPVISSSSLHVGPILPKQATEYAHTSSETIQLASHRPELIKLNIASKLTNTMHYNSGIKPPSILKNLLGIDQNATIRAHQPMKRNEMTDKRSGTDIGYSTMNCLTATKSAIPRAQNSGDAKRQKAAADPSIESDCRTSGSDSSTETSSSTGTVRHIN